MRNSITLNITIIVLTCPYELAIPFQGTGHHVINQPMLIGDACRFVSSLEFVLIDLFKDVFEAAIIFLEDGILGAHVERPSLL